MNTQPNGEQNKQIITKKGEADNPMTHLKKYSKQVLDKMLYFTFINNQLMKNIFLLVSVICLHHTTFSQRQKVPSYFGIQVKPVIPTNFGSLRQLTLTNANFTSTIRQTYGYSFGVTIRAGITKLIAFESGLNYTQRNFNLSMSLADTNVSATDNWSLINYDIPLNALVYIQLSQKTYMNTSFGAVAVYSPTNIFKKTQTGGIYYFENLGSVYKLAVDFNANVGFEYRTEKRGFFYLGGSIRVPLTYSFKWSSAHMIQQHTDYTLVSEKIKAGYISVDLKYFFPNIKKKGVQPKKGPIE